MQELEAVKVDEFKYLRSTIHKRDKEESDASLKSIQEGESWYDVWFGHYGLTKRYDAELEVAELNKCWDFS